MRKIFQIISRATYKSYGVSIDEFLDELIIKDKENRLLHEQEKELLRIKNKISDNNYYLKQNNMRTKLEIGTEYWLDKCKDESGVFVGLDGGHLLFKPSKNCVLYVADDGYVKLSDDGRIYAEVKHQNPWQFTTPIAMKCTEEQFNGIKDRLVEMGYIFYGITFGEKYRYLSSNFAKDKRCITDLAIGSKYFKECSPIIFQSFNPDLFLALAAMTDKEDGIKGECFKCVDIDDTTFGSLYIKTKENFSEMFRLDEKELVETGFDCASSSEFRKATAQEIIEHFEKKEFVLPYAYMVCVSSKEEYLSVLEYARTKGEFKEDFNDLTPNAFPYYIGMEKNGSWSYNNRYISACDGVKLTFDQFKKYVLKETEQSCQIISIPPTKQATLFDDRVEITDWKPKEGEAMWRVLFSFGEPIYQKAIFNSSNDQHKSKFIKRTESEAKSLVEKLKQAML